MIFIWNFFVIFNLILLCSGVFDSVLCHLNIFCFDSFCFVLFHLILLCCFIWFSSVLFWFFFLLILFCSVSYYSLLLLFLLHSVLFILILLCSFHSVIFCFLWFSFVLYLLIPFCCFSFLFSSVLIHLNLFLFIWFDFSVLDLIVFFWFYSLLLVLVCYYKFYSILIFIFFGFFALLFLGTLLLETYTHVFACAFMVNTLGSIMPPSIQHSIHLFPPPSWAKYSQLYSTWAVTPLSSCWSQSWDYFPPMYLHLGVDCLPTSLVPLITEVFNLPSVPAQHIV